MSKASERQARELRAAKAAEQARKAKRGNLVMIVGVGVIVALLVSIVTVVIVTSRKSDSAAPVATGVQATPTSLTSTGALQVGKATAPVTVSIYLDYQCPACKAFEEANGSAVDGFLKDGTVRVELHPMNFLDSKSGGTRYSTRAANAVAAVADKAPDKLWAFSEGLYAHQPAEGGVGLSDNMIGEIATSAGVPAAVVATFKDRTFADWVTKSNDDATKAGISSTPTIKINGEPYTGDTTTAGPFAEAVKAAAAKAGAK